jgi:hypothetical protein
MIYPLTRVQEIAGGTHRMDTAIAWVLGIATVLGGIAAVIYFVDKWKERSRFTEEDKQVTSAWWEASDLKREYEAMGFRSFGWSNADLVAERQAEGAEVIYEVDNGKKSKSRLVNRSGQLLIGRKGA